MAAEGADGYFSLVDINICMKRRSLFYSFNFMMPSIMITILSITGFTLPTECGEKIGLRKLKKRKFSPMTE